MDARSGFFLAMTYGHLGDAARAREVHEQARLWMQRNRRNEEEFQQLSEESAATLKPPGPPPSSVIKCER